VLTFFTLPERFDSIFETPASAVNAVASSEVRPLKQLVPRPLQIKHLPRATLVQLSHPILPCSPTGRPSRLSGSGTKGKRTATGRAAASKFFTVPNRLLSRNNTQQYPTERPNFTKAHRVHHHPWQAPPLPAATGRLMALRPFPQAGLLSGTPRPGSTTLSSCRRARRNGRRPPRPPPSAAAPRPRAMSTLTASLTTLAATVVPRSLCIRTAARRRGTPTAGSSRCIPGRTRFPQKGRGVWAAGAATEV
jgi:hypothetical protein